MNPLVRDHNRNVLDVRFAHTEIDRVPDRRTAEVVVRRNPLTRRALARNDQAVVARPQIGKAEHALGVRDGGLRVVYAGTGQGDNHAGVRQQILALVALAVPRHLVDEEVPLDARRLRVRAREVDDARFVIDHGHGLARSLEDVGLLLIVRDRDHVGARRQTREGVLASGIGRVGPGCIKIAARKRHRHVCKTHALDAHATRDA